MTYYIGEYENAAKYSREEHFDRVLKKYARFTFLQRLSFLTML